MTDTIFQAAALILPLVFAIVFHEVSHGLAARALGDPTAAELNRLSLNPLRHVDPIGTVILPGLLAFAHLPVFGWAKPVPVVKQRLRNPRRDMMLVAAAGPGSNLVLAGVGAVLLGLLVRANAGVEQASGLAGFAALNLVNFIMVNVFLALFNLIPIPPFDGSHILEGVLPAPLRRLYARFRGFSFALVLVVLILLPTLVKGFDPVGVLIGGPADWLSSHYLALAERVAGVSGK